jgi:hypothetical protein
MPKNKSVSGPKKTVQVKVKIPFTSTSFMSIILISLLLSIGYSGYLGVKSLWNFTHPKFEISTDAFRVLPAIFKSGTLPTLPVPVQPNDVPVDPAKSQSFIQNVNTFKTDFRIKFPGSQLLAISDNDVLNMGYSFCSAKNKSIADGKTFNREEVIAAYQAKFVVQYPTVKGLSEYLTGIGNAAFDHLCGGI